VKWYDSLREGEKESARSEGGVGRGKEGERGRVDGQSETGDRTKEGIGWERV
jgi:hypothetical protein